jgi:hypothetical protein
MLVREFWELGCRPGDYFTYCLFTFRGPGIHDTIRGIQRRRSSSTTNRRT